MRLTEEKFRTLSEPYIKKANNLSKIAYENGSNFACNDCGQCEYCQEIRLNEEKEQANWEDEQQIEKDTEGELDLF